MNIDNIGNETSTVHQDRGTGPQTVQHIIEAQVLARALFLRAGDTIDRCEFDNVLDDAAQSVKVSVVPARDRTTKPLYEPLENNHCFRVLVLEAGMRNDELKTCLEAVCFEDERHYEAISYTWGALDDKVPLRCNDEIVQIPRNLSQFLRRIRQPDRPLTLWADAVCINQDNLEERGQQVSVMRKIFQSASRVLVWLGSDEDHCAEAAFALVCDIVRSWRPGGPKYSFAPYEHLLEPDMETPSKKLPPLSAPCWKALRVMFEVDYFKRFWVIQELVVPSSAVVIWGGHHIAWPLLGLCAAWIQTAGWQFLHPSPMASSYNPFLLYTLPIAKYSGISRFSKLDMAVILGLTRERFVATDDRDRIFALLGLPFAGNDPDKGTILLTPSYRESVRDVHVRAARSMLIQDQHLRLLSAVQHGRTLDSFYPSWVPNWSGTQYADPIGFRNEQGYYANAGQLFYPALGTFGPSGESLFVKGLQHAIVVEISEEFETHTITQRTLADKKNKTAMTNIINALNDSVNQFRASWGTGTDERYGLFMFEDTEYLATTETQAAAATGTPGKYSLRESTEILTGERAQSDNLGEFLMYWRERSSWKGDLQHHDYRSFWRMKSKSAEGMERALSAFNVFPGRRIFHMDNGSFGLGPAAMQAGDVVVILFGGIVPFVLRPCEHEGRYQFVGECFVNEIMKGQAVVKSGIYKEDEFSVSGDGTFRRTWKEDPRYDLPLGPNGVKEFELR